MNLDQITQRYLSLFPTDNSYRTEQRSVPQYLACTVHPAEFPAPKLVFFNKKLSQDLGLGQYISEDLDFLTAQNLPKNILPYSTGYAGHQFGQWAGQLGDGRAIFAGETPQTDGKHQEIQWKGAGATPFSRRGDGRAVLRSSLREFLMSEAMHHLGIPTTRALSLCLSGENIVRDILYDGNPKNELGAVVVRTAESFLRFGHFEWFSAQQEYDTLEKLVQFTIENEYPEIDYQSKTRYKDFFVAICERTVNLMVDWQRVGFVHGVMNTDNMSAIGLTIDYGPYGMLEEYDEEYTPNTTDLPGKRYAFGQQGPIAQWNLWKLANALFPLIKEADFLELELEKFNEKYQEKYNTMLGNKLGISELTMDEMPILDLWHEMMTILQLDYTLFFVDLETYSEDINAAIHFENCAYHPFSTDQEAMLNTFLKAYTKILHKKNINIEKRQSLMRINNPRFVLRNYLLYECIEEVSMGKMDSFDKLWRALQNPYQCDDEKLMQKRPPKYNNTPGCSTLSCSS